MQAALIHRARQVGTRRGAQRGEQGAYEMERFEGPWIPARVMERGGTAAKARRSPQTTAARVERGYELLLGPVDVAGAPVEKPTASMVFETDCPILDSPTVELDAEPEVLNNGTALIGYLATGDVPKDRA